jgi:hypothetical protein
MQTVAANASAPQLEELSRGNHHVTFGYGNVIIAHSSASPDMRYLDSHVRETLRYGTRYPDGMGLLILIAPDEPPPNEAARKALRDCYTTLKRVIKAAVVVVEGEGFVASAKRSVITVFTSSTSQPFPIRVAGTAAEGASKLVKVLVPRHRGLDGSLACSSAP